jgi:hypothetical protein
MECPNIFLNFRPNCATPETLAAHLELASLVEETAEVISSIAHTGLRGLSKLPETNSPNYGAYGDQRFFQSRKIEQPVSFPEIEQTSVGGFSVIRIAAQTFRRQHYFGKGRFLNLPATDKRIAVVYDETVENICGCIGRESRSVSLSTAGMATYDGLTDYTFPRAPLNSALTRCEYDSPTQLRVAYANKFTGALAAANLVDRQLVDTFGFEDHQRTIGTLADDWQNVLPAEYAGDVPIQYLPPLLASGLPQK